MSIILFIFILALLVLIHEFGHFLAAKKQGVRVDEFGFGLPPRLFGIKIGETLYSLNLIPLGGFVKLFGEEYHEIKNKNLSSRAFVNKKPWQKTLIVIAGVIGNFLLGWVLISFLFTQGVPVPTNKVIIDGVIANSPAYKSGLKSKDVIINFQSGQKKQAIKDAADIISLSKTYAGKTITLDVLRNNKDIKLTMIPRVSPPKNEGPLGIIITSYEEKKYPWYQAPFLGLKESFLITYKIATELLKTLYQIITTHKTTAQVSGPIGIAKYAGDAIKLGKNAVLELIALLSFNLAIVNILPFPALDGGRLVFIIYEWITGKRSNQNIEKWTNLIGIIILLSFGILISINDIIKIYR